MSKSYFHLLTSNFFQPDHEITGQTKVPLGIDSPKLKVHFLPEYSENVGKY